MSNEITNPFYGASKKKPTLKHRFAIWENMLGTVYAMNDNGQIEYFDYDYAKAMEFAGVNEPGRDKRLWRNPKSRGYGTDGRPRPGQLVLWVVRVKNRR
jgi:hypothetical protein